MLYYNFKYEVHVIIVMKLKIGNISSVNFNLTVINISTIKTFFSGGIFENSQFFIGLQILLWA